MCVDLLPELDKFYCAWNIINKDYTTPISRNMLKLIDEYVNCSEVILEFKTKYNFKYNMSFFKYIDLIIVYDIDKLIDIPNYYKGRVIIHSLNKINPNLLKRKGLEIVDKFEYTTIRKYRDIGLFLYHLESEPWYLKNSDIIHQDLEELYKSFNLNKNITIAKYSVTLVLEKKDS